jgi:hypothetical protein
MLPRSKSIEPELGGWLTGAGAGGKLKLMSSSEGTSSATGRGCVLSIGRAREGGGETSGTPRSRSRSTELPEVESNPLPALPLEPNSDGEGRTDCGIVLAPSNSAAGRPPSPSTEAGLPPG